MKSRAIVFCAALGFLAALSFGPALADDNAPPADQPKNPSDQPKDNPSDEPKSPDAGTQPAQPGKTVTEEGTTLRFDNGMQFNVQHDASTGALILRSSSPTVRLTQAPVVLVGGREYPMIAGDAGTWRVSNEAFRVATLSNATVRIISEGRTLTTPLVLREAATTAVVGAARHGGQIVRLTECDAQVEVVREATTGLLTVYPVGDLQLAEAPVVILNDANGPTTLTLTKGEMGAWKVTSPILRITTSAAPGAVVPPGTVQPGNAPVAPRTAVAIPTGRIRVVMNGRTCEAPLVFTRYGGQLVTVENGPRFEVVPDPTTRALTFYAIDETLEGRPYVVENPQVIMATPEGTRTYTLTPVPNEPRAWRLVGLDAAVREPLDGTLRFTLGGRSLETRLGLSGFHMGVR